MDEERKSERDTEVGISAINFASSNSPEAAVLITCNLLIQIFN